MDLVDIGTGLVACDRAGSGPTVVLSHASLADRRMWRAQFDMLARDHDVIAYDRLGFGESTAAPALSRPSEDLLRLLDILGVERAALVGSSMGGGYSLDAALLAPERVTALVLVCAGVPGYAWPDAMRADVRPVLEAAVPADRLAGYAAHTADVVRDDDVAAMAEAQVRFLVVGPGRTPAAFDPDSWRFVLEMARGVFDRLWRDPLADEVDPAPALLTRLAHVRAPTLVVSGRDDVSHVQDVSTMLADGIPGAREVRLADTGHLPPVERPGEVAALLREFLGTRPP